MGCLYYGVIHISKLCVTDHYPKNRMDKRRLKEEFLITEVFSGLTNLNNGFDSPSIHYFSSEEFEIILNRIKDLKLGVFGIEPWFNGEYYDVFTNEEYEKSPDDAEWYFTAFNEFKNKQLDLVYSATYYVPFLDDVR